MRRPEFSPQYCKKGATFQGGKRSRSSDVGSREDAMEEVTFEPGPEVMLRI